MTSKFKTLLLLAALAISTTFAAEPCNPRQFNHDSIVCVCDESYCDTLDPIEPSTQGIIQIFETSLDGKRFTKRIQDFNGPEDPEGTKWTVEINRTQTIQEIIGFGGTYTDAAAMGISSLSDNLKEKLMSSYYSTSGIEYSVGKVVIAGSAFSNRPYTYDDVVDDFDLLNFSLSEEDLESKIPLLNRAQELSPYTLKLMAASWSPPAWLKTPNHNPENPLSGGYLLARAGSKHWETYAKYLVKFFDEYKNRGVNFWGMTLQNQAFVGFDEMTPWNSCGFTPANERDFVAVDLIPNLLAAGYNNISILGFDDTREYMKTWYDVALADSEIAKQFKGLAIQWEYYTYERVSIQDDFLKEHPDHFILVSAASLRSNEDNIGLGKWEIAESYSHGILTDVTHSVSGWIDLNLALDMEGGPNWATYFTSAAIIVNPEAGEFYKNGQYYAMGHFSKFLPPGSKRIATKPEYVTDEDPNNYLNKFDLGVFLRPDGGIVIIAVNSRDVAQSVTLVDDENRGEVNIQVEPHSFASWVYY